MKTQELNSPTLDDETLARYQSAFEADFEGARMLQSVSGEAVGAARRAYWKARLDGKTISEQEQAMADAMRANRDNAEISKSVMAAADENARKGMFEDLFLALILPATFSLLLWLNSYFFNVAIPFWSVAAIASALFVGALVVVARVCWSSFWSSPWSWLQGEKGAVLHTSCGALLISAPVFLLLGWLLSIHTEHQRTNAVAAIDAQWRKVDRGAFLAAAALKAGAKQEQIEKFVEQGTGIDWQVESASGNKPTLFRAHFSGGDVTVQASGSSYSKPTEFLSYWKPAIDLVKSIDDPLPKRHYSIATVVAPDDVTTTGIRSVKLQFASATKVSKEFVLPNDAFPPPIGTIVFAAFDTAERLTSLQIVDGVSERVSTIVSNNTTK